MSVAWVKENGAVAQSSDTKAAMACYKCPCGTQWSIVRLCPCYSACDEMDAYPVRLGTAVILSPSSDPLLSGGIPVHKLTVLDHGHEANGGGLADPTWFVLSAPIMQKAGGTTYEKLYVQAVEFQAPAAPFTGTISAKVYFDGVEDVSARWSGSCTEGVQTYCGLSTWDNASDVPLLKTAGYFETPGFHRVSVSVTWEETGTGAKKYVAAQVVVFAHMPCYAEDQPLAFEPPLEGPVNIYPGPEDIWIVPHGFVSQSDYVSECPWIHETSTDRFGHSAEEVLGPYDTRADAEFVLAHWMGTIASYLRDCHGCFPSCGNGIENNADISPEGSGPIDPIIDGDGGTGVPTSCASGWMVAEWGCTVEGTGTVTLWKKRTGGEWGVVGSATDGHPFGQSGYLVEPCTEYKATYSGGTALINLICTTAPVWTQPVVDCEEVDAAFALIPENSTELRSWEESQEAKATIIGELPTEMA